MQHTIVTGLAGPLKIHLSRSIANDQQIEHIDANNYRYVKGTWEKLSYNEFSSAIMNVLSANNTSKVYVSAYWDSHDKEESRAKVIKSLIEQKLVKELKIIKPTNLETDLCYIVERSLNRACARARWSEDGVAPETPESVTEMVIKFMDSYKLNCDALVSLEVFAKEHNVLLTLC